MKPLTVESLTPDLAEIRDLRRSVFLLGQDLVAALHSRKNEAGPLNPHSVPLPRDVDRARKVVCWAGAGLEVFRAKLAQAFAEVRAEGWHAGYEHGLEDGGK